MTCKLVRRFHVQRFQSTPVIMVAVTYFSIYLKFCNSLLAKGSDSVLF